VGCPWPRLLQSFEVIRKSVFVLILEYSFEGNCIPEIIFFTLGPVIYDFYFQQKKKKGMLQKTILLALPDMFQAKKHLLAPV